MQKLDFKNIRLKNLKILPIYKVISNTGPRHKPNFKIAVKLNFYKFYEGIGNSKKMQNKLLQNY